MPLPRLNYYKYQPTDNLPSLDVYAQVIDGIGKQYDKTMDERDKLVRTLGSIQSNQHGQKYLQTISANKNNTIKSLVDSVRDTGNFGLAENTIRELTNTLAGDKVLDAIRVSQKNETDSLATRQKLAEKGEVVNLGEEYDDWKPVNPDGSVNIYKPIYQNVADYHGTAKEFMKDLPTEVQAAVDESVRVPGFMAIKQTERAIANKKNELLPRFLRDYQNSGAGRQQMIVLEKRLRKEGLSDAQIQKQIVAEQMRIVSDALDDREEEVYKEKLQLVADPVWAEEVRQRQRTELLEDKREDQEAMIRLRADEQIRVAQAKAEMKKAEKAGQNTSFDVLSSEAGLKNTAVSSDANNGVSTFKSGVHVDAFKQTVTVPGSWESVQYDKGNVKVPEGSIIKGFEPRGITAYNEFDPKFDGSWYGRITYTDKDGKNERTINAHVQNRDVTLVQQYKTINELKRAELELRRKTDGTQAVRIDDVSNLFGVRVTLEVKRNAKGIQVVPLVAEEVNGKIQYRRVADIDSKTKKEMGLDGVLSTYRIEQIRNITDSQFSKQMRVPAMTKKDISGISQ